jgi:hypothetical protein
MAISIIEAAKMAKTKTNSKSVNAAINRVVAGLSGAWIVAELAMRLCVTSDGAPRTSPARVPAPAFRAISISTWGQPALRTTIDRRRHQQKLPTNSRRNNRRSTQLA